MLSLNKLYARLILSTLNSYQTLKGKHTYYLRGNNMPQAAKVAKRPRRTKSRRNRPAKTSKSPKHSSRIAKTPKSRHADVKRSALSCPKCGSTNLFWASGLTNLWSIWECRNCGYRGAFILRDSEMVQKIRENYAKRTVSH